MTTPPFPDDALAALAAWRAAHPAATLAEIEHEVDHQLSAARATLISKLAVAGREVAADRPTCPACGAALARQGTRQRTVRTAQNGEVRLAGPSYRCPGCGTGVFPPG